MATAAQWLEGARPRTLPAAIAPVAAGTGAAAAVDGFVLWKALVALLVALALQVGVNYANDYSDGVRGTDTDRLGPMRLVGSGAAAPTSVRNAALLCFAVAAAAGFVLAATTSWWLLLVGVAAIVAAWFYTGGRRPYGYRGLGEVSVFVFFGLVATVGTTYVQAEQVTIESALAAVGCGALACAILVANNLRDLESDRTAGKHTLAVRMGDRGSRMFYVALLAVAFVALVVIGVRQPPALAVLVTALPAYRCARLVLGVARGRDLVPVLKMTGSVLLLYGVLLGAALALAPAG
ncbi:MAG: 1,4-dihydroxy-2-naphthoate polyprenyltransferase [Actinomycetota bacterium]|jgi:1,4-dihydroxy-2-naphthoate octaprenyltransferase|nr:1,4-dihydroxy-2-naphthoate polyprenyltransferase [Actinomycetota bacterium]